MTQKYSDQAKAEYLYERYQEWAHEQETIRAEQEYQFRMEELRYQEHIRDKKIRELVECINQCALFLWNYEIQET